jgi:hypothetical protein
MLQLGTGVTPEVYVGGMETRNLSVNYRNKGEKAFGISGVTPNPWNTNTAITFEMPREGRVYFSVMDYTGRKLMTTTDRYQAGANVIQISKSDIGQPGVYVYELRYEDKVITGKMILIE